MVKVDFENFILIDNEKKEHQLFEHEFWYLAPSVSKWSDQMGQIPISYFGILLHNTKKSEGITPAMTDLLTGLELKIVKRLGAYKAEQILEDTRIKYFPQKPSRLRCHFLNYSKEVAFYRANS